MDSVYRQLHDLSKSLKTQTENKLRDTEVFNQNYERFAKDPAYIPKIRKDYTAKRAFYEDRLADSIQLRSNIQSVKREVNRNLDDAITNLVKAELVLKNVARNINRPKVGSLEALARETVRKHVYTDITDREQEVLNQPYKEKYRPVSPRKSHKRIFSIRKTKSLGGKSRRRKYKHGI